MLVHSVCCVVMMSLFLGFHATFFGVERPAFNTKKNSFKNAFAAKIRRGSIFFFSSEKNKEAGVLTLIGASAADSTSTVRDGSLGKQTDGGDKRCGINKLLNTTRNQSPGKSYLWVSFQFDEQQQSRKRAVLIFILYFSEIRESRPINIHLFSCTLVAMPTEKQQIYRRFDQRNVYFFSICVPWREFCSERLLSAFSACGVGSSVVLSHSGCPPQKNPPLSHRCSSITSDDSDNTASVSWVRMTGLCNGCVNSRYTGHQYAS